MKNLNDNVICGDSIEVNTYGYEAKGFVLSHFMTTRNISDNSLKVISYILIEPNNKFVFFLPTDIIKTTRIVLTEKIKVSPQLNQEFQEKIFNSEKEFKNRQFLFKSRQIGKNFAFAQSLIYHYSYRKETIEENFKGIPSNNTIFIS